MESVEEVRKTIENETKERISLTVQVVFVVDILLWLAIALRVVTGDTQQQFLDRGLTVFFWTLIIITALLSIEILILTVFHSKLVEAPFILFGVFAILVTIDVIIVIVILYGMGFITGVPIQGVF